MDDTSVNNNEDSIMNGNSSINTPRKKPQKHKFFSSSDENTIKIMSFILQLRFEKNLLYKEAKKKELEREEAIKMANRICKLRSYKSLMRGMI